MKLLLYSQRQCLLKESKDPRSRRWEKEIILLCLSVWNQSPNSYTFLRNSGFLILPSPSLLQRYKNVLQQGPGLRDDLLKWMQLNARARDVAMDGGIIFDEMAIQEDLHMVVRGNTAEYTGFVNLGKASENMRILSQQKTELLATHILQFVFLSYGGFRWPFAYFPSDGVKAADLFLLFWKGVSKLSSLGFKVDYVCMDGASSNRAFWKIHTMTGFDCVSVFDIQHIVTFLMDYSHVIKRVRNNIASSGDGTKHTRNLCLAGAYITWNHWIMAYKWDRATNPVRVHPRLTDEHMFLTKTSKMRNHLAEEVLNTDMLNLMQHYEKILGEDGHEVKQTLELLRNTSQLISIFRDCRPISFIDDDRFEQLASVNRWFKTWETEVLSGDLPCSVKKERLMTPETREDLECLIVGFQSLCKRKLKAIPSTSVIPSMINSDIVENMFCQQRATHHGANTNPNEFHYQKGITSIILGQNLVSKKSNAAPTMSSCAAAVPYSMICHVPLYTGAKRRPVSATVSKEPSPKKTKNTVTESDHLPSN